VFKRAVPGVVRSGRCRTARTDARRGHVPRCTRWQSLTWAVTLRGHAGTNALKLGARVRGHALMPGRYEVAIRALPTGSLVTSRPFRIAGRPSP
jgi:hypothetical protein